MAADLKELTKATVFGSDATVMDKKRIDAALEAYLKSLQRQQDKFEKDSPMFVAWAGEIRSNMDLVSRVKKEIV